MAALAASTPAEPTGRAAAAHPVAARVDHMNPDNRAGDRADDSADAGPGAEPLLRQRLSALWIPRTLLQAFASILFSRSLGVGGLLIAACWLVPRAGLGALLAALWSLAVARLLGIDRDSIRDGSYAISPILLGLGIAQWFGLGQTGLLLLLVFVPVSVLWTAALRSLLLPLRLPILSLPFLLSFHLLLGLANAASLPYAEPSHVAMPESAWLLHLPRPLLLGLRSIGALFFLPRADAGLLIGLALAWHSRIAALLVMISLAIGLAARGVLQPLSDEALFHSLAYNAAFVAVALGGVWFVPSPASFLLAALGVTLSTLLTVGLAAPLYRLGLPVLVLPFNLTVFGTLLALRQRAQDQQPKSVDFLAGTPEENLAYYRTRTARFRAPHPVRFALPVRGAWTCTQGVDGPLTHQGPWRHAYDFEVMGPDGQPLHGSDEPTQPADYRAYRLPVLATAAGTVVRIENSLPDNPIGTVNVQKNWGNHVVLQHGPALFSLVAHLQQGSVRVAVGQAVRVGETLGLCGNSGRSPVPHVHFQLQASPQLGSPTVPCRFSDCVAVASTAAGQPTPPECDRVIAALSPQAGQLVRNLEPDGERASFFVFPHGTRWIWRSDERSEQIESLIDLYGSLHFRSREHAASLFYSTDGLWFTAYDLTAPAESVLHLIRAALSRVPCDASESLRWTDLLPARLFRGRLWGAIVDAASPFLPDDSIEVEYQAARSGSGLRVSGRSLRRDRRGQPLIETEAELQRGIGLTRLRLSLRGRERLALRQIDQEEAERQESERAAAPAAEAQTMAGSPLPNHMDKERAMPRSTHRVGRSASLGLGLFLLCGLPAGSSRAADVDSEAAQVFQQSYDREGAGKLAESLSTLDTLPSARQGTYLAQLRRGWLLYRLGRFADAIDAYGKAIAVAPKAIEPRVGILLPQQALRRHADVEVQAKIVLAIDPLNYLATLRLAYSLYSQGRYGESAALYARLKDLYPSDAEVRSGLGWSLLKQGKSAEATRELRELLSIQPRHALAKQGLDLLQTAR